MKKSCYNKGCLCERRIGMAKDEKLQQYGAEQIQVLEGLEAV